MDDERVVRSYDQPHLAELGRLHLEQHGILARIDDAVITGMNPLWAPALGGIKLRVHRDDAERASELLAELEIGDDEAGEDEEDDARSSSAPPAADAQAKRAFNVALIGFLLCPGVLHVYSLWLALGVDAAALGPAARRQRLGALVLDALVIGMALWALLS